MFSVRASGLKQRLTAEKWTNPLALAIGPKCQRNRQTTPAMLPPNAGSSQANGSSTCC